MGRALEARFFECPGCNKCTLLSSITNEDTCPSCGSPNGQILSSSELRRRMEAGTVVNIDFSPGDRAMSKATIREG